jgi:hypothetical protein
MFAVFSLWLFPKSAPSEQATLDKKWRNAFFLLCGIGILASMTWAVIIRRSGQSIFWPESFALVLFALSWLVKVRLSIQSRRLWSRERQSHQVR